MWIKAKFERKILFFSGGKGHTINLLFLQIIISVGIFVHNFVSKFATLQICCNYGNYNFAPDCKAQCKSIIFPVQPVIYVLVFVEICASPWKNCKNICCLALDNVQTSWIGAYVFCQQQGGRLADVEELISNGVHLASAKKRCWLGKRLSYTPRDPLEGWYWLNGTTLNVTSPLGIAELKYNGNYERCAAIVDQHSWGDEPCENTYTYICKTKNENKKIDNNEEKYKVGCG